MSYVVQDIDDLTFLTDAGQFSSRLDLARRYETAKAANVDRYDGERIVDLRTGRDVTPAPTRSTNNHGAPHLLFGSLRRQDGTISFEPRLGVPVRFYIGNYQHRFAIQDHNHRKSLVHIESGVIVGDVNDAAVRMMCSRGGGAPTDREASKWLIEALVAQHGADKVNQQIKEQAGGSRPPSRTQAACVTIWLGFYEKVGGLRFLRSAASDSVEHSEAENDHPHELVPLLAATCWRTPRTKRLLHPLMPTRRT